MKLIFNCTTLTRMTNSFYWFIVIICKKFRTISLFQRPLFCLMNLLENISVIYHTYIHTYVRLHNLGIVSNNFRSEVSSSSCSCFRHWWMRITRAIYADPSKLIENLNYLRAFTMRVLLFYVLNIAHKYIIIIYGILTILIGKEKRASKYNHCWVSFHHYSYFLCFYKIPLLA